MVKFINKWTGAEMWVAEERVEEYKAAGHKLPVQPPKAPKTAPKTTRKPKK